MNRGRNVADTGPVKPYRRYMPLVSGMLEAGHRLRLKVTGASMAPLIKTGTIVTLQKVPDADIGLGDILLCRCMDGSFRLHRLVKKTRKHFYTKGDALRACEPPFSRHACMAKVIRIEDNGLHARVVASSNRLPARAVLSFLAGYQRLKSFFLFHIDISM